MLTQKSTQILILTYSAQYAILKCMYTKNERIKYHLSRIEQKVKALNISNDQFNLIVSDKKLVKDLDPGDISFLRKEYFKLQGITNSKT